jgi:hypothetical protein
MHWWLMICIQCWQVTIAQSGLRDVQEILQMLQGGLRLIPLTQQVREAGNEKKNQETLQLGLGPH